MNIQNYYKILPNEYGWRLLPNGKRIKLGYHVTIAETAKIGDNVSIGNNTEIMGNAKIDDCAVIGDGVIISPKVIIGHGTEVGGGTKIKTGTKIGDLCNIGNSITIGDNVRIGDKITIGNYAYIKSNSTTSALNKYFISTYPEKSIFWKWVKKDFMSPGWTLGKPIKYKIGSIIEEPYAKVSDQQCAVGLHVFRPGIRPEFVGLCSPDHPYICLEVEVERKDICFGGLPGNSDKLRVKKLKVIRKIEQINK